MMSPVGVSRLRALALSSLACFVMVGCAGSSPTTGPFGDGGGEGGAGRGAASSDGGPAVAQDCSGLASSQTVSEPCCLARGIDACGGNLFCAAFDGRKQPTCYLERSRLDMTECTEDRQCMSGSCNIEARKCRSTGGTCTEAVGCATTGGRTMVCVDEKCTQTDGKTGSPCAVESDCTSGSCNAENRCVGNVGATCSESKSGQCGDGLCCKGTTCADCRGGEGAQCGLFLPTCLPGLLCCPYGSSSYCYSSCNKP